MEVNQLNGLSDNVAIFRQYVENVQNKLPEPLPTLTSDCQNQNAVAHLATNTKLLIQGGK